MSKLSYRQIAEPIFKLGYAPIPAISLGKKVPAKGFGHLTSASKEDAIKEIRGWDSPHQAACWLLDALDGSGMPDLDIIDYDDGNEVAWGTAAFGATPLTVSTGTEGKMHAYYRRDPSRPRNENGSMARCFGGRDVDWRTWHGYGMAPGTMHKSGKVYQAFLDGKPVDLASIPKEVFQDLPILSRDDTDRERGVGKYAPPVPLSEIQDFDLGSGAQANVYHHGASGQVGKYPKESKDASAIIPAGPWQGKTVAQVAKHIGTGEDRIACPHARHGKAHRSDQSGMSESTILRAENGKAAFAVCYICRATFTYNQTKLLSQHFPIKNNDSMTPKSAVTLQEGDLTPEGWLTPAGIGAAFKRAGWKSSKPPEGMVLRVGQGRGKTVLAAAEARSTTAKGGRVAWVSPTRGLTWEASAINGLPCYLSLPEKGIIEGSVSVCIPSLPRCLSLAITPTFEIQEAGVDLLVLDEVEQSLRALGGDHLSDYQAKAAYHSVIGHIHAAKSVLAMDADAGALTQEIFRLAGKELSVVEGPAPAPRDALVFASRAEWLARVIGLATKGKRLVLPVHSVEEAEVLARTVPTYQGMPTAVLSRETVSKFDMSNINSELMRHGHLIYTPVIGTGVSITLKDHFDHICPLLSNSIGTASDAMQFVSRVRHPRHRGLLIGSLGGGRSPAPWESDPEQVLRVLFAREEATLQRIGFIRQLPAELAVLHDGHRVLNPDSLAYCKFLALVHSEKVQDGEGRVIKAFLDRLEANGGRIFEYRTDQPTSAAKAAAKVRKDTKEAVVEERVQEIVAATIPEPQQVEEIKRRGPKSRNEANVLRKVGIESFYGPGKGSDEATIKYDDRGRGRTQARRYAHAVVGVEKGAGLATLKGMDRREIEGGATAIRQKHRALRAEGMAALLRRLGLADLKDGTVVDAQKAADLAEWATTTGSTLMLLLGITIRRDAREKPMPLASSIVRACGLELLPKQHRVGNVVARTYTLSGVEEVASYASTYLDKLRSGRILSDVGGEDEEVELPGGCLSWGSAEELIRELAEAT